ncbi:MULTISPECIES: right-handed parallel beta-helix repeat-containing protein [unclassified Curtobacterium]|uniref:right-handed parallel beta-helix repeat-containing protein n=1 Tax=unclassified Curtobacterium TaxID=257496 RepID=UPI000F4A01EF|nr:MULTISPECIES: right-handed parallel beta-helix repeat-containing protein [unclassified Curtobacterium]ROQ05140.1 parallel beta helix pectate lyase-like protein [Curtobacterium sp. PhB171]ROQ22341.1 parallel beta helix pectate lyase-like protein [Curtobacterium sp. PhB170]ROS33701.1 parallel beta helix pectate lyase-like protein [Curtobacterium sp. PhB131]ROS65020.1 parallel beta helix pectate lyase-like protein [Curtobacterium sp. PhB141]
MTAAASAVLVDRNRETAFASASADGAEHRVIDSAQGPIVIDQPGVVSFSSSGRIVAPAGASGITITSSGVTVLDPRVEGPGSTLVGEDTSRSSAISIVGLPGNLLEGVQILGGDLRGFTYAGVRASHVRGLTLSGVSITDVAYAGVQMLSVLGGGVLRCTITNVRQQDYVNSYGIVATRDTNKSIKDAPRCADIAIVGNDVRSVPRWEGIDTHGGVRIMIAGNSTTDCATGIALVPLKGTGGGPTDAAPLDAQVLANRVTWTGDYSDTSAMRAGITIVGAGVGLGSTAERATGVVRGNTISGYGNANAQTASVLAYFTEDLVIEGNRIEQGSARGIMLWHSNDQARVTHNTIDDLRPAGVQAYRCAVDVRAAGNDVVVDGNQAFAGLSPVPGAPRYGIYAPGSGSTLRLGTNDWGAAELPLVPVRQGNTVVPLADRSAVGGPA